MSPHIKYKYKERKKAAPCRYYRQTTWKKTATCALPSPSPNHSSRIRGGRRRAQNECGALTLVPQTPSYLYGPPPMSPASEFCAAIFADSAFSSGLVYVPACNTHRIVDAVDVGDEEVRIPPPSRYIFNFRAGMGRRRRAPRPRARGRSGRGPS